MPILHVIYKQLENIYVQSHSFFKYIQANIKLLKIFYRDIYVYHGRQNIRSESD